jgi:hypothetical protein
MINTASKIIATDFKNNNLRQDILDMLKGSVDSAKVILSAIASPKYCENKSQDAILSDAKEIDSIFPYTRNQRESIYDTATIDDFPYEVLNIILKYLTSSDLSSARMVSRSWRPVAMELIESHVAKNHSNGADADRYFCGMFLKAIVLGLDRFPIKTLSLKTRFIRREYLDKFAGLMSTTLSSLRLNFTKYGLNISDTGKAIGRLHLPPSTQILESFLSQCLRIRNLDLIYFDCDTTEIIKDGCSRLSQLRLIDCSGVDEFVRHIPMTTVVSTSAAVGTILYKSH